VDAKIAGDQTLLTSKEAMSAPGVMLGKNLCFSSAALRAQVELCRSDPGAAGNYRQAGPSDRAVGQPLPEAWLFAALPGADPVFQPRLMVAFGTQRDRYANAS